MSPADPPTELQRYVDARGRAAVFLFLREPLLTKHVVSLHDRLASQRFSELDLVVHSEGGSIHAAYQVVELLRLHAHELTVCVPFYAKSAATLLCVGADRILLGELAQLGPLDVQMYEEKKAGPGEYSSALNPFKTLEQLQTFSIETLDLAMKFIAARSGMSLADCLKHAHAFVAATSGPLYRRLDPEKLGQYSRELAVGTEYASRLLRRYKQWDDNRIDDIVHRLVFGYPSHDYIIDYRELKDMGFDADLFPPTQRAALHGLLKHLDGDGSLIALLEPAACAAGSAAGDAAPASSASSNTDRTASGPAPAASAAGSAAGDAAPASSASSNTDRTASGPAPAASAARSTDDAVGRRVEGAAGLGRAA